MLSGYDASLLSPSPLLQPLPYIGVERRTPLTVLLSVGLN